MLIQILIFLFSSIAGLNQGNQTGAGIRKILSSVPVESRYSIALFDPDKKEFLFTANPASYLRPASNIKIATTAASLLCLGPDYKIKTSLYYDNTKIKGGVLKGNLFLKGGGNPALTVEDLNLLAVMLKKAGIKSIEGNLIFDNSLFKTIKSRKDYTHSLSPIIVPAISPLSINNNIITVNWEKGVNGLVKCSINSKLIEIIKSNGKLTQMEETATGVKVFVDYTQLTGNKNEIHFFLKNPPLLASLLLKEKLEENGISVKGNCSAGKVPPGMKELSLYMPLMDIINEINSYSNNYYAETLFELLKISLPSNSKSSNGNEPLLSFLESAGLDCSGIRIADGSGISPKNKISSYQLIELLKRMNDNPIYAQAFNKTLSTAGISGTLKERFLNSPIKGSFTGKSGFMSGTSSLSGYIKSKEGRNFIIAMIFNYKEKDISYYQDLERKILELIYMKN